MSFIDTTFSIGEEALHLVREIIDSFSEKKPRGYNADFGSENELLSSRAKGFCLTGQKNLSTKLSYQNCYVQAPTGGGKSTIILLTTCFTTEASLIIHDPSGELFLKSSGFFKQRGDDVHVLNFSRPEISAGFNPLARAKSATDINKIAAQLVANGSSHGKDNFWDKMATTLITVLIRIVRTQPPEMQTLANVYRLLNFVQGKPKQGERELTELDQLFNLHADDATFEEYNTLISYQQELLSSIVASAKAALQIFGDEGVAKITSFDSIDMAAFRTKRTVVYLQNSIADQRYYNVLTSIFFEQCFMHILSRFPEKNEHDIFFLIDEASSLKVPTLPLAIANVRKHRAGVMILVQGETQLVRNYSKEDSAAIRSNCYAHVYMTGQDLDTARNLESILGKMEYKDNDGKKQVRPLMTHDEIRTMPKNRALVICGSHRVIKAKLVPFYENRKFRRFSELPPVELACQLPFTSVPLIQL